MFRARTEQENRLSNKHVCFQSWTKMGICWKLGRAGPAPDGPFCSNWFGVVVLRGSALAVIVIMCTRGMLRIKGKCFQSDPSTVDDREGPLGRGGALTLRDRLKFNVCSKLQKPAYKLILQFSRTKHGGGDLHMVKTPPPPSEHGVSLGLQQNQEHP